jgi:deoxyribodipyrimidine photo-lyase
MLTAMEFAVANKQPLIIVFNLVNSFLEAGSRQFRFMLKGLEEVYNTASEYNILFHLTEGEPTERIPLFIKEVSASILFTDFDPLKIKNKWLKEVMDKINIPLWQTDAHNIIPAFVVSEKQEFSAMHFRKKINLLLNEYTEEYPGIMKMEKTGLNRSPSPDFNRLISKYANPPYEVDWIIPGQHAAYRALKDFLLSGIYNYEKRNNPNSNAVSGLSPYLHFGHLSAQRIMLNLQKMELKSNSENSFIDELIVRKELSDNYCLYNKDYDNYNGLPRWGKETLEQHRHDEREFLYTSEQFEKGLTHDDLWNASQMEMVNRGKMHGYMRMYWCKKILEWTHSPAEAQKTAIYLNDKYELDGRDPNGYAGIAWSVGGLHDRPFAERPVYGRIRYMNYNGCRRKFDTEKYIAAQLEQNGLNKLK